MMRFMICVLFLLMFPFPVMAAEYPAGSIGYVYERCRADLKDSKVAEEFEESYCGYFISGFLYGYIMASWIIPVVDEKDPCRFEREKVFQRIRVDKKKTSKSSEKFYQLMALRDFYSQILKDKNIANQKVTKGWRYTEVNGKSLSDFLYKTEVEKYKTPDFDTSLLSGYEKFFNNENTTFMTEYQKCKKDIEVSYDSPKKFNETKCGAEILGGITGLFVTKYLQYNREPVEPACKKSIDNLYKNLDITTRMCIEENTSPMKMANLFFDDFARRKKKAEKEGAFSDKKVGRAVVMGYISSINGTCLNLVEQSKFHYNE